MKMESAALMIGIPFLLLQWCGENRTTPLTGLVRPALLRRPADASDDRGTLLI